MKTLFLLFSHTLAHEQEIDAKASLGVDTFVYLPDDLQRIWSNVPSGIGSIREYLEPIANYLKEHIKPNDYIIIQGDFGATQIMVRLAKELMAKPVYATSERYATEEILDGEIIKTSIFRHVRFREYE